jgi:hypothetical protein
VNGIALLCNNTSLRYFFASARVIPYIAAPTSYVFLKWILKSLDFALADFLATAGSLEYYLPIFYLKSFYLILKKNFFFFGFK